jgi:hypothetical protein
MALAGGAGLATAVLLAVPAQAAAHHPAGAHHGYRPAASAVYVQTDNLSGNSVVAYRRNVDGTLTQADEYATGGLGGALDGSVVDHLASQGSLTYDRGSGLPSGGTFPVSVAVHDHLVYVLNARDGGSVQGYVQVAGHLFPIPAWHRALGLDPTETPEFTSTPGQVAFAPDGSKLIVTTKNNKNQIDVFDLGRFGSPSPQPVITSDAGNVPFAVTFDAFGRLQVAEAGPNAVATYSVNRNGTLTFRARVTTGQNATCWITTTGRHVYLGNAGSGTVSVYSVDPGGLTSQGTTATEAGTVDLAISADGRNLYAQTGAAGIVDEFRINADGTLTSIGSVLVPGAVGGQGIATA